MGALNSISQIMLTPEGPQIRFSASLYALQPGCVAINFTLCNIAGCDTKSLNVTLFSRLQQVSIVPPYQVSLNNLGNIVIAVNSGTNSLCAITFDNKTIDGLVVKDGFEDNCETIPLSTTSAPMTSIGNLKNEFLYNFTAPGIVFINITCDDIFGYSTSNVSHTIVVGSLTNAAAPTLAGPLGFIAINETVSW